MAWALIAHWRLLRASRGECGKNYTYKASAQLRKLRSNLRPPCCVFYRLGVLVLLGIAVMCIESPLPGVLRAHTLGAFASEHGREAVNV